MAKASGEVRAETINAESSIHTKGNDAGALVGGTGGPGGTLVSVAGGDGTNGATGAADWTIGVRASQPQTARAESRGQLHDLADGLARYFRDSDVWELLNLEVREFRDLGDGNGHLWGHVQAIKGPALLEIAGPLFMSYPVVSNVQYRLKNVDGGTLITIALRSRT